MIFFKKLLKILAKAFLVAWCLFSVLGFIWILITSLKTNRELFKNAWGLFTEPQWDNYASIWTSFKLSRNFLNSIYVVSLSVIEIILVCTPAAYVLSRVKFFGSRALTSLVVFGMGVPFQLLLIPLYFSMHSIGMVDSLFGLSIVYCALSIPFTVFLEMGFFRNLPTALAEAAYIDGSGPMKTFLLIMLPLGMPGVITAAIFNFVSLWNEFLLALTFLNSDTLFTLPVGLFGLQTSMQYTGKWTTMFAGFVIVTVPTMVIYMLLSRKIISGLTMGAIKE